MPRIIVEHEDVGAWTVINSSFLRRRYWQFNPDEKKPRNGPWGPDGPPKRRGGAAPPADDAATSAEVDDQQGRVLFRRDELPGGTGHGLIEDVIDAADTEERKGIVPVLSSQHFNQLDAADRRRGVLFQLGTFPGEDPNGSHVDFRDIELRPANSGKDPIILERGDSLWWMNIMDLSIGKLPMNPFHATYFWPTHRFRGSRYRKWHEDIGNAKEFAGTRAWFRGRSYMRDKLLHGRLRLDEVDRPPETLGNGHGESNQDPKRGAIVTYWNGLRDFSISVQHQRASDMGAPYYLRYEFTLPEPIRISIYGWPGELLTRESDPTDDEVAALRDWKLPKGLSNDPSPLPEPRLFDDIEEVVIRPSTWRAGWTHGGVHIPWELP